MDPASAEAQILNPRDFPLGLFPLKLPRRARFKCCTIPLPMHFLALWVYSLLGLPGSIAKLPLLFLCHDFECEQEYRVYCGRVAGPCLMFLWF